MPKFVVERHIPGIGSRSEAELDTAARRLQEVAAQLGSGITWEVSFVTDNTMFCVFSAPNTDLIRFHGLRTGFPADQIAQIREVLSPEMLE